jgi:imidazolonepropionase
VVILVSYVVPKFSDNDWDQVWAGANIATMAGADPYGSIHDAAIAVKGDRIAWLGAAAEGRRLANARGLPIQEMRDQWITPGLIDCHTHLVYGGNRVAEFEQRLCGASYEDIARAGGGIQSTMRETRTATKESLYESARRRIECLMADGVTTVEIKSGYGLELAAERRSLEVARALGESLLVTVKTTFLGLHSLPPEFSDRRQRYIEEVCGPWLTALAAAGLVDAVDSFCENIAFSVAETEQFLQAARKLGIAAHVHAGQLSDMGAAQAAAKWGALSADHLEFLSAAGAASMASAGTVAVLLPTAYFTLRQTRPPPIDLLRGAGVPLAVATDSNPGTSPCTSLLLALSMACTLFGLTPAEALAGATRNGARALGMQSDLGTIEVGKRADLAFWRIGQPAELCYGLGGNPCAAVMYGGIIRAPL